MVFYLVVVESMSEQVRAFVWEPLVLENTVSSHASFSFLFFLPFGEDCVSHANMYICKLHRFLQVARPH